MYVQPLIELFDVAQQIYGCHDQNGFFHFYQQCVPICRCFILLSLEDLLDSCDQAPRLL